MSSYKDLDIWQRTRILVIDIHKMTLSELPKFEMFEEGSQLRRSIKSVQSNIVEGYGRRVYKQDFLKFLTYAFASCCESTDHLEILFNTGSLKNSDIYNDLHSKLDILGKKLNLFIQAVEKEHKV